MTAHSIHAGTQHPRATHHIRSLSKICAGGRYVVRRICRQCLPMFIGANAGAWDPDATGDVASFPCCIQSTVGGGGAPCRQLASKGTLSVTRIRRLVPSLAEPFEAIVEEATQRRRQALEDGERYRNLQQEDPTFQERLEHVEESAGWRQALGAILTIRAEVPVCPGCGAPQCAPGEVSRFQQCCALFCSSSTCPVSQRSNGFCFFCGDEQDCVRLPTPKCPAPPDHATTKLLHMPCRIWGFRSPPV